MLAYAAEEAARLNHKHIGTEHLLLGLLREEKCFGAQLLREQRLMLDSVREQAQQSGPPFARGRSAHFAHGDQLKEDEDAQDMAPAEKLAQIQRHIDFICERMEHAIANHEFEKARFYSNEERKERENLRLLRDQFDLEERPPRVPLLCIDIIREESFSEVQRRCNDYIAEGVAEVWLLEPRFQARLYRHQKRRPPRVQGRCPPDPKPAAGNGSEDDI